MAPCPDRFVRSEGLSSTGAVPGFGIAEIRADNPVIRFPAHENEPRMSRPLIDALRAELGPGAGKLPDLSSVPDPALNAFIAAVQAARRQQRKLLQDSSEHALRLVPALLRPAVRKILFG